MYIPWCKCQLFESDVVGTVVLDRLCIPAGVQGGFREGGNPPAAAGVGIVSLLFRIKACWCVFVSLFTGQVWIDNKRKHPPSQPYYHLTVTLFEFVPKETAATLSATAAEQVQTGFRSVFSLGAVYSTIIMHGAFRRRSGLCSDIRVMYVCLYRFFVAYLV